MVDHGAGGSAAVLKCGVTFHAADKVPHLLKAVPNGAPSPPSALHVWCHWLMAGASFKVSKQANVGAAVLANIVLLGAMKDQFYVHSY